MENILLLMDAAQLPALPALELPYLWMPSCVTCNIFLLFNLAKSGFQLIAAKSITVTRGLMKDF